MLESRTLFIADTYINDNLTQRQHCANGGQSSALACPPKWPSCRHSNYGSSTHASALKMRAARDLFVKSAPHIECDGEMHGDAALVAGSSRPRPARQLAAR